MISDLAVRPATTTDDPRRVFELLRQLAPESRSPEPARQVAAWQGIIAQLGRRLYLAERGTALVGSLDTLVVPNLTHDCRPHLLVENMVVDQVWRRRGVATALMEAAIDHATTQGCYKIQLLTDKTRVNAHALYERAGFEATALGYRRYL